MTSEKELLGVVLKLCPGMESKVERLYDCDDDFRSLCEDYHYCLMNLNKYNQQSEEEKQFAKEFERVCEELEKEIFNFIFQ